MNGFVTKFLSLFTLIFPVNQPKDIKIEVRKRLKIIIKKL